MNRKAFIGDLGLILVVLFFLAVMAVIGYKIYDSYNDKWQTLDVSPNSKQLVQNNKDRYTSLFDGIFMFVFALLCIALFISVATVNDNPAFFFIMIIIVAIFIGGAAVLSNSFENIAESPQLNATTSEFQFIPFLMDEMPIITLFLGVLIMAGLYMKIKGAL